MPWKPSDAQHKTKEADTPEKQKVWRDVANERLAKTGDEGRAIREANAVVKRMHAEPTAVGGVPKHRSIPDIGSDGGGSDAGM